MYIRPTISLGIYFIILFITPIVFTVKFNKNNNNVTKSELMRKILLCDWLEKSAGTDLSATP